MMLKKHAIIKTVLGRVVIRDVEAVIFQPLPLPLTKNEKTTVDNFF